MDSMKEKIYIPSQTALYDPEMWIFAGVDGAGKTSMMGTYGFVEGKKLETSLTEEDILRIKEASQNHFIRMNYIALDTLEEHLARIQNRVRKGASSADPEDVKKQFEHRFESLARVLPLCNEVCFYDNDNGFRLVGIYHKNYMELSKKSCRWFREFLVRGYLNTCPAKGSLNEDEKTDLTASYIRGNHKHVLEAFGM